MGRRARGPVVAGITRVPFHRARGTPGASGVREEALSAADAWRFTTIAHEARDILGPLSPASIDAIITQVPRGEPGRGVIDIGCGKGEILVRVLRHTGGHGIGVEPNPAFAADARARGQEVLGPDRVRIVEDAFDAAAFEPRAFDLAICTGAIHAFGDWASALRGVSSLVADDGWALMAPAYWRKRPDPAYLSAIEGEESEMDLLPTTLSAAENSGWNVIACHESTAEEWDDYEHTYAANMRAWCDAHPDDPEAAGFRKRIADWAAAYAQWGRDTMGYALLLMQRKA